MLSVTLLSAMSDFVFLGLLLRMGFLPATGSNTSTTVSHNLSEGVQSNLRPASKEISFGTAVRNSCLLLAVPANRHECVASQNAQHAPTLILSEPGHLQSRRPGKDLSCTRMQFFPHGNIVCNHS